MSCVFGPVPSRRLGYSLGVDIVPAKVCTLDCVYCQVGQTTLKTVDRKEWVPRENVLRDLQEVLARDIQIDFITFSGSGEPTLHAGIGQIIQRIKQLCAVPVAVLTNGTLLSLPEVRADLMEADLIVPSLDAVTPAVFERINCPHEKLRLDSIVAGLKLLRKEFRGDIWLEVMVVKGINDSREELKRIERVAREIKPDKIQINSVSRPPAQQGIGPADNELLGWAGHLFGGKAEIIGEFHDSRHRSLQYDLRQRIAALVKRRPCSVKQISQSLGAHEAEIVKHIGILLSDNSIVETVHEGEKFYKGQ